MLEVTVVIATYNRGRALLELLGDLDQQTLAAATFQVIVVDDGSRQPVDEVLRGFAPGYGLNLVRQPNQGPAAARDRGVRMAAAEVVVILDDDMRVGPTFLASHLEAHRGGAQVVLGLIAAAPQLAAMPLFERFHAHQLAKFVAAVGAGSQAVHGIDVCTGNVSLRRSDYLAVGGFDRTLDRSEDRELGLRLEKHGAKLVFCAAARSVHASDHDDLDVWMRRAFLYGVYDHKIARKHPDVPIADPWRFFFLVSQLSRPLIMVPLAWPRGGRLLSRRIMAMARACDRVGLTRLALNATTLTYGLEYFRGVRQEEGSLAGVGRALAGYARRARGGGGHAAAKRSA